MSGQEGPVHPPFLDDDSVADSDLRGSGLPQVDHPLPAGIVLPAAQPQPAGEIGEVQVPTGESAVVSEELGRGRRQKQVSSRLKD